MARSGKSSQVGVPYRRPPTSVRNLPAGTAPAESGVGAEQIVPPQRGGLSGPGMRVYPSGIPSRRIVNTHSSRSRRAYRTVRPDLEVARSSAFHPISLQRAGLRA